MCACVQRLVFTCRALHIHLTELYLMKWIFLNLYYWSTTISVMRVMDCAHTHMFLWSLKETTYIHNILIFEPLLEISLRSVQCVLHHCGYIYIYIISVYAFYWLTYYIIHFKRASNPSAGYFDWLLFIHSHESKSSALYISTTPTTNSHGTIPFLQQ